MDGSKPSENIRIADFESDGTRFLDRAMPAPSVLSCAVLWYLSPNRLSVGIFAAAFIAANVALNILIEQRQKSHRSPGILLDTLRGLLSLVLLPPMVFVAGPVDFFFAPVLPALLALPFLVRMPLSVIYTSSLLLLVMTATWAAGNAMTAVLVGLVVMFSVAFIAQFMAEALRQRDLASRRLTEEVYLLSRQAASASEAKSRFLATMSHEIRTPMNGVLGIVDVLAENPQQPDASRLLALAQRAGQALLAMVNGVLDLSRIESGEMTSRREPCDLKALAQDVEAAFSVRLETKDVSLEIHMDCSESVGISDPVHLRQVLFNLVGNAVKFTERGSVRVAFAQGEQDPGTLLITVTDTGKGIELSRQKEIFEPFKQEHDDVHRTYGGTGLGLSLVHSLVKLLDGRVSVKSAPGMGSEFSVVLPWQPAKTESDSGHEEPDSVENLSQRVLVVEDNAVNRVVARRQLESLGHQVHVAEHGAQAVDMLLKDGVEVDLVLMDFDMPVMNGIEATLALRAGGFSAPIVALSASMFAEDRDRCLAAGMDGFLMKPLQIRELDGILKDFAGASKDPRAA